MSRSRTVVLREGEREREGEKMRRLEVFLQRPYRPNQPKQESEKGYLSPLSPSSLLHTHNPPTHTIPFLVYAPKLPVRDESLLYLLYSCLSLSLPYSYHTHSTAALNSCSLLLPHTPCTYTSFIKIMTTRVKNLEYFFNAVSITYQSPASSAKASSIGPPSALVPWIRFQMCG